VLGQPGRQNRPKEEKHIWSKPRLTSHLVLFLTFALLTIGELGPSNTWHQIGGWTGVATAIAAWYAALAGVLRSTFKRQILPVFPT
jgi:succinate-acetate transporter protein